MIRLIMFERAARRGFARTSMQRILSNAEDSFRSFAARLLNVRRVRRRRDHGRTANTLERIGLDETAVEAMAIE